MPKLVPKYSPSGAQPQAIEKKDAYLIIIEEGNQQTPSFTDTDNIARVYVENVKTGTTLRYWSTKNIDKETIGENDINVHVGFKIGDVSASVRDELDILPESESIILAELFIDEFRGCTHSLFHFSKYRARQLDKTNIDIFQDLIKALEITAEKLDGKKHKVNTLSEPFSVGISNSPNSIPTFLEVIDTYFDTDYATLYIVAEQEANYRFSVNNQSPKSHILVKSNKQN